jgi:hypothetical protein
VLTRQLAAHLVAEAARNSSSFGGAEKLAAQLAAEKTMQRTPQPHGLSFAEEELQRAKDLAQAS